MFAAGHAKDYVRMMWMMLQQDEPDDFVIATNEVPTFFLRVSPLQFVSHPPRYRTGAVSEMCDGCAVRCLRLAAFRNTACATLSALHSTTWE